MSDRRPLPVEVLAAGEDECVHAASGAGRSVRTARIRHVAPVVEVRRDDVTGPLLRLPTVEEIDDVIAGADWLAAAFGVER